jgi:hypothetical protein
VVGMCLNACGTSSGDNATSPPPALSAVDDVSPSRAPTSVDTAGGDGTDVAAVVETVVDSTTEGSPTPTSTFPSSFVALIECFAAHGVDPGVPAQPASPIPAGSYSPEVAADAWGACRGIYLDWLREFVGSFNVNAELPAEAAPLAFADCMATLGWMPFGPMVVEVLDGYIQANAVCRTPVEGESVEASYCRFLQAINDRASHDRSMSVSGIPYTGTDESRRQAAVALYDEALQIAPEELIDDLHTLQDGFRPGTPEPKAVGESVFEYHLSVCGAWVYLGSLD